jgi:4-hydroxybenzoate polyprenyltransferase
LRRVAQAIYHENLQKNPQHSLAAGPIIPYPFSIGFYFYIPRVGFTAMATPMTDTSLPLAVDLDGTLIRTDSLWEGIFAALRNAPWLLFFMPVWLFRGKAYFKKRIAKASNLDASLLPYDPVVVAYVKAAAKAGRPVALVTGANQRVADAVAGHLGIFGISKGSNSRMNLTGKVKAAWLQEIYPLGFEYVGNHAIDRAVWEVASVTTVAGNRAESILGTVLTSHDTAQLVADYEAPAATSSLACWLSAMRVHQWSKNLLLFVPFVLAGSMVKFTDVWNVLLAVAAFSLLASATYIINDLLDLPHDRQHPTKSQRAFARCILSIPQGVTAIIILLLASGGVLLLLNSYSFALIALAYAAITLSYSFYFKREPLLDVMVLSSLYTLRISAGAVALHLAVSWWLVSFSFLFFLSLALMKRYAELELMRRDTHFATGRDYQVEDMPLLQTLGVGSSCAAVVLFIIYLVLEHFSYQMFSHPGWLWPIGMLILLWQTRLWLITCRGQMDQDPIYFALKDRASLKLGGLCLVMVMLAW